MVAQNEVKLGATRTASAERPESNADANSLEKIKVLPAKVCRAGKRVCVDGHGDNVPKSVGA